ncbi:MAG: hypothetical protein WAW39_22890 [Prosthecobacter sp.]|uniref:hypothetical protein n=1 Tax=Prosthecobacter sp. TaxID=1965333 RepID=UPI003BAF6253
MRNPTALFQDLPARWQVGLLEHLRSKGRDQLSAGDFPCNTTLVVRFEDDSEVRFQHAFAIRDKDLGEIGVFTEHCGYHVFPGGGTVIEVVQS